MLIPSARVYREIFSSEASIWFLPASEDEAVVALKLPSTTIQAVVSGCSLELLFGRINGRADVPLCTGLRCRDTIDRPLISLNFQNHVEQYVALGAFLREGGGTAYLFNELDMCVAWARFAIEPIAAGEAREFVGDPAALVPGEHSSRFTSEMDTYEEFVGHAYDPGAPRADVNQLVVPLSANQWEFSVNHFVGARERGQLALGTQDDGLSVEAVAWFSLDSVFPGGLLRNPIVEEGNGAERELTDVLAFYQYGHFLIEAKALSESGEGFRRSHQRKILTAQKHTRKAISQLVGASKAIRSGRTIKSESGAKVNFDRDKPPHCIVLLAELQHEGDWNDIVQLMAEGMDVTGGFFHVLDLRELILLLKGSNGKAELFDNNLMERAKHFANTRSIHIRSRIPPNAAQQAVEPDVK